MLGGLGSQRRGCKGRELSGMKTELAHGQGQDRTWGRPWPVSKGRVAGKEVRMILAARTPGRLCGAKCSTDGG